MKFNLTEKERIFWEHAKHVFSFVFQTLLLVFLLVLLLREFYPDRVNAYININWFMIVVIVFGALSILFPPSREDEHGMEREPTSKDKTLVISLGILGAVIIFLKIRTLGWIGYVISILGGLIIILLSWLILNEKNQDSE